jgi:Pyridoxamine 5'-phosphate oxidase
MIDVELKAFLEDAVGIHLGTRSADNEPNGVRAVAAAVEDDGQRLVVYLAKVAAKRVLPDLEANGQAAVSFGRPVDERACQVKGVFEEARDAREDERARVASQWESFLDNLEQIGIGRLAYGAWVTWPCVAIRLKVSALFNQTPGPGTGAPLP